MTTPRVSVLVNTYNRAGFLRNCLEGYLRQTVSDFEIVIADDGSSDGTDEMVRQFARRAPYRVEHVWHEDDGHRRTVILNKGIVACEAPYILFTDCDALPPANLVEVHCDLQVPKGMLCGGLLGLTEAQTQLVTPEFVAAGEHETFLTKEVRRSLYWKHCKNSLYIAIGRKRRPHNLGMNYSVWKEDLLAINGYDEEFRGWGGADGDVRERMRMIGVRPLCISHRAVVFHQHHVRGLNKSRRSLQRNKDRLRRKEVPAFCEQGIHKSQAPEREAAGSRGV